MKTLTQQPQSLGARRRGDKACTGHRRCVIAQGMHHANRRTQVRELGFYYRHKFIKLGECRRWNAWIPLNICGAGTVGDICAAELRQPGKVPVNDGWASNARGGAGQAV